jgi:hypothetical protein
MTARRASHPQEHASGAQPPLDPALVRLIEALAEDQVEQDYAARAAEPRQRADLPPRAA